MHMSHVAAGSPVTHQWVYRVFHKGELKATEVSARKAQRVAEDGGAPTGWHSVGTHWRAGEWDVIGGYEALTSS